MERIDYILDFCKELGKQMIVSGANIERVNMTIERICHAYGLHDVTCANLSTRISISAKDEQKHYASRQTDVPPQALNLERLKKLNNLSFIVTEQLPEESTLPDLLKQVKSNDFPWWVIMIGFIVAMAMLARMFNAYPAEILIVELTLIAMAFYQLHFIENFYVVIITNAFFLIPGIPMINCARNLLCGNEMNGIIDLLKVLLEVTSIVAGLAAAYALLGSKLDNSLLEPAIEQLNARRENMNQFVSSTELVVLTLLASAGFSIVFNIQWKDLPFAAAGGMIVRIFYILFQLALPDYRFVFVALAAFFAALYSEILAITKKEPSTLFLYPSIVPLIPGDLFFYVALGLVWQNHLLKDYGPSLVLSLVGISLGFVLCSTIVHYVRKFKFLRKTTDETK